MTKKHSATEEMAVTLGADSEPEGSVAEPSGEAETPGPSLAPGEFIGPDGRRYRRRHEPQGSGWRDWSELVPE